MVVPANPLYTERELLHLLEDSGSRTIITLDLKTLFNKVNAVKQAAGLENIIVSSLQEYMPFPHHVFVTDLYSILAKNFSMVGQWVEPGGSLPYVAASGRNVTQIICKKDKKKFVTSTP